MIAALVQLLLAVLDLGHCARVVAGPHGLRCPVVRLAPPSCAVFGWHDVLGTPVCVRGCGAEGAPTT